MTDTNKTDQLLFPIRELSARTQVNTVTLRAWERRYGLLKPQRSDKGHRLYSQHDVTTIETILTLVARGVPIGKVKPLLEDGASNTADTGDNRAWQEAIDELVAACTQFSASKAEQQISKQLANYPTAICRRQLIEPAFAQLGQHADASAALGFAESELLRYVLMRINAKTEKKRGRKSILLMAGHHTPLWRLALTALEFSDAHFEVQLLIRPFDVASSAQLAQQGEQDHCLFYQDGIWKAPEQKQAIDALSKAPTLLMCGTAPQLTQPSNDNRVFANLTEAAQALQQT